MSAPQLPEPSRTAGLNRINEFTPLAGERYAADRNFDFGTNRRTNVSTLSPYLRHRLILEEEVLRSVLSRHTRRAADKFVAEIFWRAYFKGHLEQHPGIWTDYRKQVAGLVAALGSQPDERAGYERAVSGQTGIDCFDHWVEELITTGYLHNHARMWFASIWVFTLQLPWQLGADFFYRHLIDGDPASNTLAWRWVSGLHTPGKTYLARVSNIFNYTDRRFAPQGQLAITAPPLTESIEHEEVPVPAADSFETDCRFGLLVTEEDCSPENLPLPATPAAITGFRLTQDRSLLPVGEPVLEFASGAVNDAVVRAARAFDLSPDPLEGDDWAGELATWARDGHFSVIVTAYAPVGPVADRLRNVKQRLAEQGIRLLQLRREYDELSWPHARRGYFKLKSRIPQILDQLDVPYSDELEQQASA